jgi:hypothetical protein
VRGLLATLLLLPAVASAETWLVGTIGSYHLERDKQYCEVNPGVGIEHGDKYRFVAGTYHNSLCQNSNYVGISATFVEVIGLKFGTALLAITGYQKTKRGSEAVFAPLPFVSWEGKRLGVNVALIPPYDDFKGALGLQLKVRF